MRKNTPIAATPTEDVEKQQKLSEMLVSAELAAEISRRRNEAKQQAIQSLAGSARTKPKTSEDFESAGEYVQYLGQNLPQNENGNAVSEAMQSEISRLRSQVSGQERAGDVLSWLTGAAKVLTDAYAADADNYLVGQQQNNYSKTLGESFSEGRAIIDDMRTSQKHKREDAYQQQARQLSGVRNEVLAAEENARNEAAAYQGYEFAADSNDFAAYAQRGIAAGEVSNPAIYAANHADELAKNNAVSGELGVLLSEHQKYLYLTDDELQVYSYYLAKEGREKADEYIKAIDHRLEQRRAEKQYETQAQWAAEHPWAASGLSVATNLGQVGSVLNTAGTAVHNLFSEVDKPVNQYSPLTAASRTTNALREGTARNFTGDGAVGTWLQKQGMTQEQVVGLENFLYSTGMSMADCAASLAVFGPNFSSAAMSANAAGATAYEAAENGLSAEEGLALAGVAGAAEFITERMDIDRLLSLADGGGRLLSRQTIANIITGSGAEATEELITSYANTLADIAIAGDKSQYQQYIAQLMEQGMTREAAKREADYQFFFLQPMQDAAAGALSGGVLNTGGAVVGDVSTRLYGRQFTATDAVANGQATGSSSIMAMADELNNQIASGGRVSNYDIGRVQMEADYYNGLTDAQKLVYNLKPAVENGTATAAERAIYKVASGEKLTDSELRAIYSDPKAQTQIDRALGTHILSDDYTRMAVELHTEAANNAKQGEALQQLETQHRQELAQLEQSEQQSMMVQAQQSLNNEAAVGQYFDNALNAPAQQRIRLDDAAAAIMAPTEQAAPDVAQSFRERQMGGYLDSRVDRSYNEENAYGGDISGRRKAKRYINGRTPSAREEISNGFVHRLHRGDGLVDRGSDVYSIERKAKERRSESYERFRRESINDGCEIIRYHGEKYLSRKLTPQENVRSDVKRTVENLRKFGIPVYIVDHCAEIHYRGKNKTIASGEAFVTEISGKTEIYITNSIDADLLMETESHELCHIAQIKMPESPFLSEFWKRFKKDSADGEMIAEEIRSSYKTDASTDREIPAFVAGWLSVSKEHAKKYLGASISEADLDTLDVLRVQMLSQLEENAKNISRASTVTVGNGTDFGSLDISNMRKSQLTAAQKVLSKMGTTADIDVKGGILAQVGDKVYDSIKDDAAVSRALADYFGTQWGEFTAQQKADHAARLIGEAIRKDAAGQKLTSTEKAVLRATEKGEVKFSRRAKSDVDPANENAYNENRGDIDGGEESSDTGVLGGQVLSAVNPNSDTVRQSRENSRALHFLVGMGKNDNARGSRTLAGGSGFLEIYEGASGEHDSETGLASRRFCESNVGNLRRRRAQTTDTAGRRLSPELIERLSDTVLKDDSGHVLSLFHWTDTQFDKFEKGDLGFHAGTLISARSVAYDKPTTSEQSIYKELFVNITSPVIITERDPMHWTARFASMLLVNEGVITESEVDVIANNYPDSQDSEKYDAPALVALRELLKSKGYDGIIYTNDYESGLSIIAFDADQIITVAENGVLKPDCGVTMEDEADDTRFSRSASVRTTQISSKTVLTNLAYGRYTAAQMKSFAAQIGVKLHSKAAADMRSELATAIKNAEKKSKHGEISLRLEETAADVRRSENEQKQRDREWDRRVAERQKTRAREAKAEQAAQRKAEAERKRAEKDAQNAEKARRADSDLFDSEVHAAVRKSIAKTEVLKGRSGEESLTVEHIDTERFIGALPENRRAEMRRLIEDNRSFAQAFGHKVIFITDATKSAGDPVNGFYRGGNVYVNIEHIRELKLKTVAHEITHDMAAEDTSLITGFYDLYREYCEKHGRMDEFNERLNKEYNLYSDGVYGYRQLAVVEEMLCDVFADLADGDSRFFDYCVNRKPTLVQRLVEFFNRIISKLTRRNEPEAAIYAAEMRGYLLDAAAKYKAGRGIDNKLSGAVRANAKDAQRIISKTDGKYQIRADVRARPQEWSGDISGNAAMQNLRDTAPRERTDYGFRDVIVGGKKQTVLIVDPQNYLTSGTAHMETVEAARSLAANFGIPIGFTVGQSAAMAKTNGRQREVLSDYNSLRTDTGTLLINLDSNVPYTHILTAAWCSWLRRADTATAAEIDRLARRIAALTGRNITAETAAQSALSGSKAERTADAIRMNPGEVLAWMMEHPETARAFAYENPNIIRRLCEKVGDVVLKAFGKGNDRAASLTAQLQARLLHTFSRTAEAAENMMFTEPSSQIEKRRGKKKKPLPDDMRLMSIDPSFERQVDEWDGVSTGGRFYIGTMSDVLQKVGMPAQRLYLDHSKARAILEKHPEMSIELIKQIPQLLENPVVVIESTGHPNRVIAFGDLYDAKGQPVMSVVEMNLKGNSSSITNISKVISAYGRSSMNNFITKENLLYVDPNKKRTTDWFQSLRLQLPVEGTRSDGYIRSITPFARNSKGQYSAGSDADLETPMQRALREAQERKGKMKSSAVSSVEESRTKIKDTTGYQLVNAENLGTPSSNGNVSDNTIPHHDEPVKFSRSLRNPTRQENRAWLDEYSDQYGAIPEVENVNSRGDQNVPRQTADDTRTRQTVRTYLEALSTPDNVAGELERDIINGTFAYTPVTNKAANNYASDVISRGIDEALAEWHGITRGGKPATKNAIALGERLIIEAASNGNTKLATKMIAEVAAEATRAGQVVQAISMVKRLSPTGQLLSIQRQVDKLNDERQGRGKEIAISEDKLMEFTDIARQLEDAQRRIRELDEMLENGQEHTDTGYTEDELTDAKEQEQQLKDKLKDAKNGIITDVAEQVQPTWKDKMNAWRYLAMLGNPRTHIRNVIGNMVFIPAVKLKQTMASGMEHVFIKKGERSQQVTASKSLREFAAQDAAEQLEWLKSGGKYNATDEITEQVKSFSDKNIVGKTLNKLADFNSWAMDAEDGIFLKYHYQTALAGWAAANGMSAHQLRTDEALLQKARAFAAREAQRATYRDMNAFSDFMSQASRKLKAKQGVGGALAYAAFEGVVPFKKTPCNIVKRSIEYSPIGVMTALSKGGRKLWDSRHKVDNDYTATEFINDLSAGMTGTMIVGLGALLASLGVLRGRDKDKEDEFEKLQGAQEYSLVIGDWSYTIDWMSPVALPLFVGAELYDQTTNTNEEINLKTLLDSLTMIAEPIFNLSMLDGVQSTLQSYSSEGAVMDIAFGAMESYAGQFFPTIGGQIARSIDPLTRNAYYTDRNSTLPDTLAQIGRSAMSKIPGIYSQLPERIDAWGRNTGEGQSTFERIAENFFSPGYYSQSKTTEVDRVIQEIYDATGDSSILPAAASKFFSYNGQNYYMSADEYVTYAKTRGQTAYSIIDEMRQNSEFTKLSPGEQAACISDAYKLATVIAKLGTNSGYTTMDIQYVWQREAYESGDYAEAILNRR